MKISAALHRRLPWFNLPGALLFALLQRMPAIPLAATAEQMLGSLPIGAIVRSAFAVAGLGAMHSLAGATAFIAAPSASPLNATVGTPIATEAFAITGAPSVVKSWKVAGAIPPGLQITGGTTTLTAPGTINAQALTMTGTPTTNGSYTIALSPYENINLGGNHAGPYNFVVNVTGGSSATAPGITTQPASQSVNAGATVTFTVAATGSPSPTLQWQKNGTNISGATSATLTLSNVALTDAGSFTAIATNSAGSATSNAAVLNVTNPAVAPGITTQPVSQMVLAGASVTFNAAASGTPAPTYQWRKNGANISGATAASLTLTGVVVGDSGSSYTVVATNSAGSATSSAAVLTVNAAPGITTQPVSQAAFAGSPVTITVVASGAPAPSYQWQKNSVNISGATAAGFTISSAAAGDAGSYTVIVTNSVGTITSSPAVLTVSTTPTAPAISAQPQGQTALVGGTATFAVTATGYPAPTYQWSKNGVAITGATTANLTLGSLTLGSAGSYTVVVTNAGGSVTSNAAVLTVFSSRLTAMSIRSPAGPGDSTLIAGVVLNGTAAKRVVFRGVSSTLSALGVSGVMSDPILNINRGPTVIASNDNWGGGNGMTQTFASVGLAPLAANSLDAAMAPSLAPGVYTAAMSGSGSTAGIGLLEVYDGDTSSYATSLTAMSVRGLAGPGPDVMIVGLVVSGSSPLRVVVRGIGPSLGASVPTRIPDPELRVYRGSTLIQTNDNWGGDPALANAFGSVGLMPLAANSKDAAALVTLDPGIYTIQVSDLTGAAGIALVEVYALP